MITDDKKSILEGVNFFCAFFIWSDPIAIFIFSHVLYLPRCWATTPISSSSLLARSPLFSFLLLFPGSPSDTGDNWVVENNAPCSEGEGRHELLAMVVKKREEPAMTLILGKKSTSGSLGMSLNALQKNNSGPDALLWRRRVKELLIEITTVLQVPTTSEF